MSTFEVKIKRIDQVEHHPNADRLDLARIDDYRCVVGRDQYQVGQLVAYIPEAAVLPEWLIEKLGLVGKLAGKDKNRVKAVKLRGVLSQGLVYPTAPRPKSEFPSIEAGKFIDQGNVDCIIAEGNQVAVVREGDVVTDFLGITKYEPPIPTHMGGEVFNAFGMTLKYDIENFKKYPTVLEEGEEVVMTEKIHGTWCCLGYHPDHGDGYIVTSKGLSEKGLAFKMNENNLTNLYVRALNATTDSSGNNVVDRVLTTFFDLDAPFYILGEVYGVGVQDLLYGADEPQFRVFDIYVGQPGQGHYIDADKLQGMCAALGVEMVPTIYAGPFSKEAMEEATTGKETVSGQEINIREGVVIKPIQERQDLELGRVILKSVSEAYLLRKGGTEYT